MKSITTLLVIFIFATFAVAADSKDERPFCKTVEEAANWVLKDSSPELNLKIARTPKDGLVHHHFGLGRWIRNNVPVWGNTELLKSVGKGVHPDNVGGMILDRYWQLARAKLPQKERERIEYFETQLSKLNGSKPTGKTHWKVIKKLNDQITAAWPKDAPFEPYLLKADADTQFTWEPRDMTYDLKSNVGVFVRANRSSFYRGDYLCVGDSDK
jgi:hypothetical protein